MRARRRGAARPTFAVVAALLAALASGTPRGPRRADARPDDAPATPKPGALAPAEAAKARAAFDEALALAEKGSHDRSRKKFREFLEKWPAADAALRQEADERSAENCFLGVEEVHAAGPSRNRIDVELMGDGYVASRMDQFRKHAVEQMKAFWAEPLYEEYESYFNVWRFDLVSKDDGVDEAPRGDDPGAAPDPRKRREKRALKEYSTALNCVAAGPQNQVCADPEMVFKWRKYLRGPDGKYLGDGLSICFAKKGALGMGGGGIATTGRLVAVVHEFGHAFVDLLDEYSMNGGAPPGRISAANAVSGRAPGEPPDPRAVPWKHWLDAKNPEVGVFEGGATYAKDVYRPAAACAMNSGGSSPYCWVCREAGVRMIYEYVDPVDDWAPSRAEVRLVRGVEQEFWVRPMTPKTHRLSTEWWLERLASATPSDDEAKKPAPPPLLEEPDEGPFASGGRFEGGKRGRERTSEPWPDKPPAGERLTDKRTKEDGGGYRSTVVLPDLQPGRYRLTAVVKDDTRLSDARWHGYPWVLRDPYRLLEERKTWTLEVREAK
jgi:hypothetical protein